MKKKSKKRLRLLVLAAVGIGLAWWAALDYFERLWPDEDDYVDWDDFFDDPTDVADSVESKDEENEK